MKKIIAISLFVASFNVTASDWKFLWTIPGGREFVDASSLIKVGKYHKAWFLVAYDKDQYSYNANPMAQTYIYRSYKQLIYFKCSERSSTIIQSAYYSGENSDKYVPPLSLIFKIETSQFYEITPDTDGEAMFNYACADTAYVKK